MRAVVFSLLSLLCACHESHDVDADLVGDGSVPSDVPAPTGGTDTGTGGSVGDPGTGGAPVGDPSVAGTMSPPPVVEPPIPPGPGCVNCQPAPMTPFGDLPPCCTATNRCGLDTSPGGVPGCVERDAAGVTDPSCPDWVGSVTRPGCCRYDGMCGAMFMMTPFGCANDPAAATLLMAPPNPPRSCGPVQ